MSTGVAFIKCNACPTPAGCHETDVCFNALVICHTGRAQPASAAAVWQPVAAPPKPAAAPPSAPRAAGGGSVTDRIFAACDAALLDLGEGGTLDAARKAAIPRLEAAGVNINSARKGSSMWIQARR